MWWVELREVDPTMRMSSVSGRVVFGSDKEAQMYLVKIILWWVKLREVRAMPQRRAVDPTVGMSSVSNRVVFVSGMEAQTYLMKKIA